MKRKTEIVLGITALTLLAGVYSYKEWTRTAESMGTRKAEIVAAAPSFAQTYDDAKHLGKIVEINGTVSSVSDLAGKKYLILDTGDPLVAISCEMDSTIQTLSVNEGSQTSVRCQCDGKLTDVQLSRCVFIEK
jgi:tRNA_anti-like